MDISAAIAAVCRDVAGNILCEETMGTFTLPTVCPMAVRSQLLSLLKMALERLAIK